MTETRIMEIRSTSSESFEDAICQGMTRVSGLVGAIRGAWVDRQSALLSEGKVKEYRVDLRVTYVLPRYPVGS